MNIGYHAAAPPLKLATRTFLTARWQNLCLFNYQVDPSVLSPLLPPGLTLDLLNGRAFVSLVAFDFLDTRVLSIPLPGFRNFPEINLRFYVREGERRGVAFVRELVPSRVVAWVARTLYNEPYVRATMRSHSQSSAQELTISHTLHWNGIENAIFVRANSQSMLESAESEAHFFKEHAWGYGVSRQGLLNRYEVEHEVWETYPILESKAKWDFAAIYGERFGDLNHRTPHSVLLAKGSPIRVSTVF
jgi:uncharacterized protein YqjF (DUF2071 family)